MLGSVLQVAIGGAIGASARYLMGLAIVRTVGIPPIPLAIMAANVLGSFLMGVFVVLAAQRGLTHLSPFVVTGLLGGFTTFSSFSLEAVPLYERGEVGLAGVYVAASVVLSIAGLMTGLAVARWAFS
jgi:CrcB protein